MVTKDMLKITEYEVLGKLPDPFLKANGARLKDPSEWAEHRKELYKTAVELQYGTMPPAPEFVEAELIYNDGSPRGYRIHTGTKENPVTFRVQVFLPEGVEGPVPVIVIGDQCWKYMTRDEYLNAALSRGVAWAFFDRTELAHDVRHEGRRQGCLYKTYPNETFGAIGAWAWGYSRVVDALEQLDLPLDLNWIIFAGHSRGGKTAALAGALDERARIVAPNETTAGGHACYRIHMKGIYEDNPEKPSETLADLWRRFDFWMGPEMGDYADREADLPFDTHFLKALVAPRTLIVSEAAGDLWGNPPGSYITTMAAREVYRFLGAEDHLYWYFRPGFHKPAPEDIERLINVLWHEKTGEPLLPGYETLPFEAPDLIFDWRAPK